MATFAVGKAGAKNAALFCRPGRGRRSSRSRRGAGAEARRSERKRWCGPMPRFRPSSMEMGRVDELFIRRGRRSRPLVEDLIPVVIDPDLPCGPVQNRRSRSPSRHPLSRRDTRRTVHRPGESLFPAGLPQTAGHRSDAIIRLASAEDQKRQPGHSSHRARDRGLPSPANPRARSRYADHQGAAALDRPKGRGLLHRRADGRFPTLLRELGRRYRRRVEMRPLGVRDGAEVCGGLGPCGRCLCCATFMDRFHSVTVRMAKRQKLSLNPTKISGLCGRLMCCLAHEVDQYPDLGKTAPFSELTRSNPRSDLIGASTQDRVSRFCYP